ncbi:MAG: DHH family phosphoesterase [Candidatus Aenigmarchaeota archaeon]|nr:DHH family phosphoesterase [Candidatus Aenigmarchaeota archaeon]
MDELIKKAADFLKRIKQKDGIIIVFNNDLDGMCSCVMIKKYLSKIGNNPYIISQPMPPDKNLIRRMQSGISNKVIFLDMAIDQSTVLVKKIKGMGELLIIDHHLVSQNLNSRGIVHCNPRIKTPGIYQSTSYVVHKILGELENTEELDWIAALGAIADYDLSSSQDLVKKIQKRYDIGKLHKIVAILASLKATRTMTCEKTVDALMAIKEPENILETEEFIRSYQEIENEKQGVMINTQSDTKVNCNIVLYEIKSKYNIRSEISTRLAEKYKDKIVIVYEKIGKKINASVRCQTRKFNVDSALKKASANLNASAGGHEAAGGITIDEKDWSQFIDNLLALVNQ